MTDSLTIASSDDWHLHLRDGESMKSVLLHTAARFSRALIMPNLKPAITTVKAASAYRKRILAALPRGSRFDPLMTLYLTDNTPPAEIIAAKNEADVIMAAKCYPAGATTNSDEGVTDIAKIPKTLEMMEKVGMPLCVHGEVVDPAVDVFDREKAYIDRVLQKLVRDFPGLKIVLEHITTREGVEFVLEAGPNIAATITAHHLTINRTAMFQGGIRPHNYCLPIAKREEHRQMLLAAATSGNPKFFLGTDSAPHMRHTKENACGCAGCYTAYAGIELYANIFDQAHSLDKLEGFASFFGADFYGLPRNKSSLTLVREDWIVPEEYPFGDNVVVPFLAGGTIHWKLPA